MAQRAEHQLLSDAAMEQEELGLGLKTVAWTLLAFDWIIVVYVWMGLRAGSSFWLWWVLLQAAAAAGFMTAGAQLQRRAEAVMQSLREASGKAEASRERESRDERPAA
jgi:hypothetical protein